MPLSEQGKADRATGLGGTDGSAVIGVNPWKTPMQVYLEKVGLAEEATENIPMRVGNALEPLVAKLYQEETGVEVLPAPEETIRFSDKPFIIGHPDFLVQSPKWGKGVLEVKTTASLNAEDGEMPKHYIVQAMHYAGLLGLPWFAVAVLVDGKQFYYKEYETDEDFLESYYGTLENFWRNHVEARVPPEYIIGRDNRLIKKLAKASGELPPVALGPDAVEIADRLEELKRQINKLSKEKEDLEATIIQMLGDASRGVLPSGGGFVLSTVTRPPYEARETVYRVLRRVKKVSL